jgi:hypothetical protein
MSFQKDQATGNYKFYSKEDVENMQKNDSKVNVMKYEYDAPVDKLNAVQAMTALQFIRKTFLEFLEKNPEKTDMQIQEMVLQTCYEKELLGIRFANAYPLLFLRLTQRETTKQMFEMYQEMLRVKLNVDIGLADYKEVTNYLAEKIYEYGSRKATDDEISEKTVKHGAWKDPLNGMTVRNLNPLPLEKPLPPSEKP